MVIEQITGISENTLLKHLKILDKLGVITYDGKVLQQNKLEILCTTTKNELLYIEILFVEIL